MGRTIVGFPQLNSIIHLSIIHQLFQEISTLLSMERMMVDFRRGQIILIQASKNK